MKKFDKVLAKMGSAAVNSTHFIVCKASACVFLYNEISIPKAFKDEI